MASKEEEDKKTKIKMKTETMHMIRTVLSIHLFPNH